MSNSVINADEVMGEKLCSMMCSWTSTVGWEFLDSAFSAPAVGSCFTYPHTCSPTDKLSLLWIMSHGFLLRARGGVFNNHSNKCLRSYCFTALLRCTRGSAAACKSTGIHCASVSHEALHLFPSPRRTQLAPSFSKHTIHKTQYSNLH